MIRFFKARLGGDILLPYVIIHEGSGQSGQYSSSVICMEIINCDCCSSFQAQINSHCLKLAPVIEILPKNLKYTRTWKPKLCKQTEFKVGY